MARRPAKPSVAEQGALALMRKPAQESARHAKGGYLDLLESPPPPGSFAGRLMRTRIVPLIYERWWRPALSQVAKGVTGPRMGQEAEIAMELLRLERGATVLDVACGPGNFSREFGRSVGRDGLVVGIDASDTMLSRGVRDTKKARQRNVVLVRGDATDLPFLAGRFDAVCCFGALHLFDDPFAALDEFSRVLRPGGRVALMTSARRRVTPAFLKPLMGRVSGMRIFDQREITGALADRGFEELESQVYGMVQFTGGKLR
jgi:SAM-dependent methyltransferase